PRREREQGVHVRPRRVGRVTLPPLPPRRSSCGGPAAGRVQHHRASNSSAQKGLRTMPTPPKNAKQPADHKPKAAEVDNERTITVRGVEVTVAADALDDFELLDDLAELE